MTATPIPRTLAMTVYGDLDVSVIDQLPPGRKPIQTRHYRARQRSQLFHGIRTELEKGRQVYFVYPLIDDNEKLDLLALERGYEAVCEAFAPWKVGRVHGRMKPAEKEEAMRAFSAKRDPNTGVHNRDRSGSERAQCFCDGRGECGAIRLGTIAPTARTRGKRGGTELLHLGHQR